MAVRPHDIRRLRICAVFCFRKGNIKQATDGRAVVKEKERVSYRMNNNAHTKF
jgi:hypothetical protein